MAATEKDGFVSGERTQTVTLCRALSLSHLQAIVPSKGNYKCFLSDFETNPQNALEA